MDALPPDPDQQRHQINYDLTILMRRPVPIHAIPSAQGIGLFTHASEMANSSNRRASMDVTFLPLGGPRRLQTQQQSHDSLPTEIKQAWQQLRQAIEEEERNSTASVQSATSLKAKYGGLIAPEDTIGTSFAHLANKERQNTPTSITAGHSLKRRRSSAFPQQPTRRASEADAAIGSTVADGASASKRRNIYEADRDPRRRGRPT